MAVAVDVEAAVLAQELHQVDGREVARGVVEEEVLRAVVHDEAVRDEVVGDRLGQVEDVRLAGRLDGEHLVGQLLAGHRLVAVEPGQGLRLRALRVEADRLLEERAGGAADPQRVGRVGPRRRRLGQPRVLVEPRLDAEGEQQELGLAQQLERRRVEGNVARLLAVVGHGAIRGEEAAEHRGQGRTVQLEDGGGEADGRGALVEDRELAEDRHRGGLAQHEAGGGGTPRDDAGAALAAEPAHRLERGAAGVDRLGDRGQHRRLAGVGGEDERLLRAALDDRLREIAFRHRHADAQGELGGEAAPAEAGAPEHQTVAGREVGHRHVAAAHREDLVIAGDAHPVAAGASGDRTPACGRWGRCGSRDGARRPSR